jgi:hypothetical protein
MSKILGETSLTMNMHLTKMDRNVRQFLLGGEYQWEGREGEDEGG